MPTVPDMNYEFSARLWNDRTLDWYFDRFVTWETELKQWRLVTLYILVCDVCEMAQGIHGFQVPSRYSFGQSLAVPVAWSSPRTPRSVPARQSFTVFWIQIWIQIWIHLDAKWCKLSRRIWQIAWTKGQKRIQTVRNSVPPILLC